MERLGGISIFVEAVDAGGFSAAAERLNLSRSAVGKTIAKLEQRLGVRLFHRTTRTQSLTAEGQLYYESCLRAVGEIRAGEALLESGKQEIRGRLRMSLPVVFGRQCVMPLLSELLGQHPLLELDVNFSDRRVDLVEDGFDLAIRTGPLPDEPDVMARKVADQPMTVCASPPTCSGTARRAASMTFFTIRRSSIGAAAMRFPGPSRSRERYPGR